MANEFWLTDAQWAAIEPLIPMHRRGVKPGNNREIISGILHVLKFGCRWRDCPAIFGPHTTVYNRFNRWSKDRIWQDMLGQLVKLDESSLVCIDSTTSKAAGEKATVLAGKHRFRLFMICYVPWRLKAGAARPRLRRVRP